ncbi:serine carboxypeptidase-like 15 isoform X2 [Amaranthus tricolor]|uniref:serine carboxypeptidase-like 15 isoform X2 n=1 Tax=Amaranthus tricolor TaxID=29722 RepID=UPI002585439C|nr:serine carboxypeptidase-like 15 isoform X2 [Amaranthus tricolor]
MIKINMFEYFILKICLILHFQTAISLNIVKTIPGYPGNLPFYLETGYVGVGEEEEVELFYYFTKSERNPEEDPLMIWLTGGPGCSAFSGLVLEIGPLIFNTSACNWHSKSPTYQTNPFSWTKVASIIFLDSPVGTGFSYATTPEGYYSDDVTSSRHIHQFLRKWFIDHAGFLNNPLYISGDSYSGKIVPIVVQTISNGNKIGLQPIMNLQGYVLGNPFTVREDLKKSAYRYARRVSLLSDELYESTKISCNGSYEDVDVLNVQCIHNLEAVSSNLDLLFNAHVLKPKCISDQTWCQSSGGKMWIRGPNQIMMLKTQTRVEKMLHCFNLYRTDVALINVYQIQLDEPISDFSLSRQASHTMNLALERKVLFQTKKSHLTGVVHTSNSLYSLLINRQEQKSQFSHSLALQIFLITRLGEHLSALVLLG